MLDQLRTSFETAEPLDAAVLTVAAVFGLWIVVELVRAVARRWWLARLQARTNQRHVDDWYGEGGLPRW